ncbi:MAG: class I SAM-dependent methyltransferase [Candidatus Levybacteria bacterium]|nr:class I SAM-dependent methyltransferase [Candidatus Levybacteria bacterium]
MQKVIKCDLCSKSNFKFLYKSYDRMFQNSGEFQVKKCINCGLFFLDPKPSELELKKYYPSKKYYSYSSFNNKNFFGRLREYLVSHYYNPTLLSNLISIITRRVPAIPAYKKDGKVLDIGCGAGDTLFLLKKLGWEAYGLEIDKNAILAALKNGLENVKEGGYKAVDKYKDNFFDAVRLYHVIEHIDDPRACLKEIYKKLKKNGELIIGTPNIKSLNSFFFRSYWYNLDSPRHLYIFNPKTLERLLREEGYKIKKTEYCSAGGLIGSIQYFLRYKYNIKTDLLSKLWLVMLFYPVDWISDKTKLGDVFVVTATK